MQPICLGSAAPTDDWALVGKTEVFLDPRVAEVVEVKVSGYVAFQSCSRKNVQRAFYILGL
jgi:hypothetical protein